MQASGGESSVIKYGKCQEESGCDADVPDIKRKGLMVDAGTMSHIITKFKRFDNSFQAKTHSVELYIIMYN